MTSDKKVWDWRSYILHYAPDNPTYKHILLTLSCYMDSAGSSCFPSIDTLEKTSSLSRPTIVKYLKKAQKDGWIKVDKHGFAGREWKRNEYTASMPDKVVKEVNHEAGGGKTDNGRQLTSHDKVVKEVNSISPYTSPSNSGNFTEQLEKATDKKALLDIWLSYRKQKGKHATVFEQDVILNNDWENKSVNRIKEAILHTVKNGWISLQWPEQKEQTKSPFRPDAVHL